MRYRVLRRNGIAVSDLCLVFDKSTNESDCNQFQQHIVGSHCAN
ncbi:hypothetical protein [Paenibacillus sp. RC67]|nr:hypothetical protein [Paenibacillus sp. RC67]